MPALFPERIQEITQADKHQIFFAQSDAEVKLPEHTHVAQWGLVLECSILRTLDENTQTYPKGHNDEVVAGALYAGTNHTGHADVSFFKELDRYPTK